jgi:hypothetical protein
MTGQTIKEALEASRRFELDLGPARLHLRLPTDLELRDLYRELGIADTGSASSEELLRGRREVVLRSVVGWSGVSVELIAGVPRPESYDHVPFSRELLLEWFAEDAGLEDALSVEIWRRVQARREAREADRKNWPSASGLTATEARQQS